MGSNHDNPFLLGLYFLLPPLPAGATLVLTGVFALMETGAPPPGQEASELAEEFASIGILYGVSFVANLLDSFGDGRPRDKRRMGMMLGVLAGLVLFFMLGLSMSGDTGVASLMSLAVVLPVAVVVLSMRALRLAVLRRGVTSRRE